MTKVVLRAHYYPTNIWSGMIVVPRRHARAIVADIDKHFASHPHPKVNFFMYIVPERLLHTVLGDETFREDVFVLHVYDAFGEKHGRETFRWALEVEGAIDRTRVTNMRGIVDLQRKCTSINNTDGC
jgi:hypothetical protein